MGLLSIFQSKSKNNEAGASPSPGSASDVADLVQQARVRARHRLIGASVLLMIGIIIFPLLFETQPRRVAVDIPIEIPRKEGAASLVMPPAKLPRISAGDPSMADIITETHEESGREILAPPDPNAAPPRPASDLAAALAASPEGTRFVVQVGAFTEASAARDVRAKLDKAGVKTFVQNIETPEGKRFRVRVGPFNSREEADKALSRIKSGGVPAVVLVL